MGCKLCKNIGTTATSSDDESNKPNITNNNNSENKKTHIRTTTNDSVAGDIRRRSWKMRQSSIGPFIVTTEGGETEDHVTVLDGDDLVVLPESSPLLLERLPVLFDEEDEEESSQTSGRDSMNSATSSNGSGPSSLRMAAGGTLIEMSDDWSSSKTGPGALRLTNSSTRRAAYQV